MSTGAIPAAEANVARARVYFEGPDGLTLPAVDPCVRVLSEQCETCIFRPGNLMNLRGGRVKEMVRKCMTQDTVIPCHELLDRPRGKQVVGPRANGAICRGFFDHYEPTVLQIAKRLGAIQEVSIGRPRR